MTMAERTIAITGWSGEYLPRTTLVRLSNVGDASATRGNVANLRVFCARSVLEDGGSLLPCSSQSFGEIVARVALGLA